MLSKADSHPPLRLAVALSKEKYPVQEFATSDITAPEAHQRQVQGALLLDVREPFEWSTAHAPGAVNVPLGQLATRCEVLPRDQDLLVICASGSRSALAVELLRHVGYQSAKNVEGGMLAWQADRLPIESETPTLSQSSVHVRALRTRGLGDTTYFLTHNGVGLVVDPQRDVECFLEVSDLEGVRLRYVLETHLHNDYVSGGRELARRGQAELVLPAGAGVAFNHTPAFHMEDLASDGLVVRPIHTPGHTPEHVSYLILIDARPAALFSGGSLLVGSAGRPDLLGSKRAHQFALAQFQSVQRLVRLPEDLALYPTHGEGSFCTASSAGRTTSTIGLEKRTNPLLQHQSPEAFARVHLAGLQPYPKYYAFMVPINTLGPAPLSRLPIAELDAEDVHAQNAEVHVVDARPRTAFAAGHIPGAIGVELADDFGTWVGWLLPFDAPIVLVLEPDQALDEAVVQLARIGFEQVRGVLRGIGGWHTAGFEIASYEVVDADGFAQAIADGAALQILDVRSPSEWQAGSLPGASWRYVPDLVDGVPEGLDTNQPVWLVCASGFRASIAAALLERHGYRPVVLAAGGVADVMCRLAR
jgi:rhodanese-related sulfurtransferase/glyoxylase-like metal-dependent hydrolase (beta-lactamase superfamily II)